MFYFGELTRITLYYMPNASCDITKLKYYLRWFFDENYQCSKLSQGNHYRILHRDGQKKWRLYGPASTNCIRCKSSYELTYADFSTTKNKIMCISKMGFSIVGNESYFHYIDLACKNHEGKIFSFARECDEGKINIYKFCQMAWVDECGHCVWPLPREYLR